MSGLIVADACSERFVEDFGGVVRALREARGWSQEALAGAAGLSRSYVGEIERAEVVPSLATAHKLAAALGVRVSEMIARSEPS